MNRLDTKNRILQPLKASSVTELFLLNLHFHIHSTAELGPEDGNVQTQNEEADFLDLLILQPVFSRGKI